jgi:hypothetical protein
MSNVNNETDFGFSGLVFAVKERGQARLPDHELIRIEF